MTTQIDIKNPTSLTSTELATLIDLVIDSVAGGASVGWVTPPSVVEAQAYWQNVLSEVESGETLLFVAVSAGAILGTVQLQLSVKENGAHRGEVARLLVHSHARRRGIAARLMATLEAAAWSRGLKLLILDTRTDDPSQRLYEKLGWQLAGIIPDYARGTDGTLQPTSYMYKQPPGA